MRQKIDIADVEAATKIRAKYLRALENEEFALLPGNTFVKTFLRTYAEYLGLDSQLLLEEYRAGYEPRGDSELQPYSVAARRRQRDGGRTRQRRPSGPPGPGTAVIVVVGVLLVIFAILGLTSGSEDNGNSPKSGAAKKPSGKPPAKRHRRARPRVTSIRLRAVPAVATYMCVDRGAGTPVVYQGTTSDPQTFKGKRLRINGGGSSLRLSVNGRRVRVTAPAGQPIGYEFRLRHGKVATRVIPNGQRPCQGP